MSGGIKELVADVEVKTTDIQACAVTTAKLGGSAVTTAKLGNSAVTSDKLSNNLARYEKYATVALTANATAYWTFTATAAITVFDAIVQVTAAGTTGDLTMANTAGDTIIGSFVTTAVGTCVRSTSICTVAAGKELQLVCTASKTNTALCTVVLGYFYN